MYAKMPKMLKTLKPLVFAIVLFPLSLGGCSKPVTAQSEATAPIPPRQYQYQHQHQYQYKAPEPPRRAGQVGTTNERISDILDTMSTDVKTLKGQVHY